MLQDAWRAGDPEEVLLVPNVQLVEGGPALARQFRVGRITNVWAD